MKGKTIDVNERRGSKGVYLIVHLGLCDFLTGAGGADDATGRMNHVLLQLAVYCYRITS